MFDKNDYISILKSEIKEIQWNVKEVLKDKDNAIVILGFNYENKMIGSIEFSMIHEANDWKIDDLKFP